LIHKILKEINEENGSLYKLAVLKKYKDELCLPTVLRMTYDRARFTYGLTVKPFLNVERVHTGEMKLTDALSYLIDEGGLALVSGNAAKEELEVILCRLAKHDAELILQIINRDLRINCGRSQINKVFKGLIIKPAYMRCDLYSDKTSANIEYPAFIQLKADGTYREVLISDGRAYWSSRSGEVYEYPILTEQMKHMPDGYYFGELVVEGSKDRADSNGQINSSNPPHDKIIFHVWDYVTSIDYRNAIDRINDGAIEYYARWEALTATIEANELSHVKLIESHLIDSAEEAMLIVSGWMKQGLEGGVLKSIHGIFKDGTSKLQLKMKLEIDVEVRITGFKEGKPGTIRAKTFGSITYKTDDGKIEGSASGFNAKQLKEFSEKRDEMIGMIITLKCNDITRARGSETYALSHPRFIEIRYDRLDTDTLERAMQAKQMAMTLKKV